MAGPNVMLKGGRAYYGQAIGILLFDGRRYPMAPGDVGNASTYAYPVRLKVVPDLIHTPAPPESWIDGKPPREVELLVAGAHELEAEGLRAIVACCGFFSVAQDAMARAVRVPVFGSSLLLVPILHRMLGGRTIGIVTASKRLLVDGYLRAAGIGPEHQVAIAGLDDASEWNATHMGGTRIELDVAKLREETVAAATGLARAHPGRGAILLECTSFPTFAADVQAATGLPVFDYVRFIDFVYHSVVQRPYDGFV